MVLDTSKARAHVPKRRRTQIACEACRTRKRKCSGSRPVCHDCRTDPMSCVYRDPEFAPKFVFRNVCPVKIHTSHMESSSPGDSCSIGKACEGPFNPAGTSDSNRDLSYADASSNDKRTQFRIPFFRWFGPTGIAPGYKKFMVDIKHDSDKPVASSTQQPSPSHGQPLALGLESDDAIFEPDHITPRAEILFPLLDIFFNYYSCHFPFHSRDSFILSVRDKKVPALLLNSMCALAARFSDASVFGDKLPYVRGEIFAVKAKHLLVPHPNLPSFEVVESILMIAWTELGTCHDVGLWMYTGMAVRMAEDLGMHKTTNLSVHGGAADGRESKLSSNLFWAINFLDHIICFATGRPLTTRRECITVPLPKETLVNEMDSDLISPFPAMIRVMQTQGLVNEELGALSDQPLILSDETKARLLCYGDDLVAYYTSLHPALRFDVQNFRAHTSNGQGGTFLLLHLWFNSTMIALHRPGLRFGQENHSDGNFLCPESRQIALSSALTISSILSLAELVDSKVIIGSPFIDQAVEIAGLEFIAEMKAPQSGTTRSAALHSLEGLSHQSNYQTCLRVLQTLLVHWRGIAWILTTMDQKYKGVRNTDPGEDSADPNSLVSLHDKKMIQRLLSKVGRDTANSGGMYSSSSAIGVAVMGTTNMPAKGTVTVVESTNSRTGLETPSQPPISFDGHGTTMGSFTDEFEDNWAWTSWIDHNLFDNLDIFQGTDGQDLFVSNAEAADQLRR